MWHQTYEKWVFCLKIKIKKATSRLLATLSDPSISFVRYENVVGYVPTVPLAEIHFEPFSLWVAEREKDRENVYQMSAFASFRTSLGTSGPAVRASFHFVLAPILEDHVYTVIAFCMHFHYHPTPTEPWINKVVGGFSILYVEMRGWGWANVKQDSIKISEFHIV